MMFAALALPSYRSRSSGSRPLTGCISCRIARHSRFHKTQRSEHGDRKFASLWREATRRSRGVQFARPRRLRKSRSWLRVCGEYYKSERILEELLVQKIVVETARYGRVLALEHLEQPEPGYNLARVVHSLDRTSRYSTATSRALYKAIEELERHQAARKAREESAASNRYGTGQVTC